MPASSGMPRRRKRLVAAGVVIVLIVASIAWMAASREPPPGAVWLTPPIIPVTGPGPTLTPPTIALAPGGPAEPFLASVAFEPDPAGTWRPTGLALVPQPGLADLPRIVLTQKYDSGGDQVGEYEPTGETRDVGGATWQRWTLKPERPQILARLARWDRAGSDARRAAAEDVARRLPSVALLRLETFSCGGQTHEMAIYSHAATGMEFVLVPGGTFVMGSPPEEGHRNAANETQHPVTLSPFLMARTEMTQGAWKRIAGAWAGEEEVDESERGDLRPVSRVTWSEVTAALRRVDLSLPTEAQWEFACRAGTQTTFFTGPTSDTLVGFANLGRAWRDGAWLQHPGLADNELYTEFPDGFDSPAPVATFRPNAFGLHDMIGNVAEWCADGRAVLVSHDGSDKVLWEDYPAGPARDPLRAPGADSDRIIRGGWWKEEAGWQGRSANRHSTPENSAEAEIGFRPARAVPVR